MLKHIPERFLLSALLLALVTLLLFTNSTWRLDQLFYDWKIQNTTRSPAPDILIVAVDEQSLHEMGRWPWSRSIHADLVQKLSAAGARVIGLDILFSEPETGDPDADHQLATSIANSGRVVLPVTNEQQRLGGQLIELLPLPELMQVAVAIGHVERQLDPDSIVRSTYLKAGLGTPRWSSFALSMLEVADPEAKNQVPGLRRQHQDIESPMVWTRDHQIWIPYTGPPGTIPRVSYVDVIMDRLPREYFTDAFVIVGATAVGLGDSLPTPVSGHSHPMPGVEIVANELDALRQDLAILPLSLTWTWIASIILVLAPTLLYPRTPRWSLSVWGGFIILNILFSMLLLGSSRLWFAPASALIVQFISYPLWSWRRLVQTLIYLNRALQTLHAERAVPNMRSGASLSNSMSFLRHLAPISGAVIMDGASNVRDQWGETLKPRDVDTLVPGQWRIDGAEAWIRVAHDVQDCFLGVRWKHGSLPNQSTLDLFQPITVKLQERQKTETPHSVVEYLQRRIQQVQAATDKIQFMRRFVTDTLAEVAPGIIVTDGLGEIIIANPHAEKYLGLPRGESAIGHPITKYLFELETFEGQDWHSALHKVMTEGEPMELTARAPNGLYLLAQLSRFTSDTDENRGLLLSFADISALRGSERQRRDLVTFISHDLRSPLSSILAITGIAKIDPQRMDTNAIERIEGNAYKTLALADDFIEFNRAEAAERSDFHPINLATVAHHAIDSVSDQALAKNINLERELPDEANIMGDTRLLERTFVNLLENAVKYCPSKGNVKLEIEANANSVRCIFQDTGYGVSKTNIEQIFKPFQRAENPSDDQKGSFGLGLSFVKTVVDLHLGQIEVESELDVGSRFILTFPADVQDLIQE